MFDSFTAGIYVFDFEFHPVNGIEGNSPDPVCLVVLDLNTGVTCRYFREQLRSMEAAPFDTGPDSLGVAFYAPAEMDCFIQLGWPLPENVLDIFVEFRNLTNGRHLPHGASLLCSGLLKPTSELSEILPKSRRALCWERGASRSALAH